MPTENEVKFVLRLGCEEAAARIAARKDHIQQGYLISSKGTLRFRKKGHKKPVYFMTFKHSAPSGRVIEIEKEIDQRDFTEIWPSCINRLEKLRYFMEDAQESVWEVDFFRDHNNETYFALAEFEMPEGMVKPETLHPFVKEQLIYAVPATDSRFSSKALADVRYAQDLYKTLTKN